MKLLLLNVALLGLAVGVGAERREKKPEKPEKIDHLPSEMDGGTISPLLSDRSQTEKEAPSWSLSQLIDPSLPRYAPRSVTPPKDAHYLLRDGSIRIVGYNDMGGIFENLNALFVSAHSDFKFTMQLKGTATAAPALTHGVSAFAPMGAKFSALELAAYRSVMGHDPISFRVAHCSLNPQAKSAPVGIYLNRANPLDKLTVEQIARIFTACSPGGDIARWGQLGLTGEWARRAIHPYGIAEEAAAGLARVMLDKMGGRPFTPGYNAFLQSVDVVKRVGEDAAGVGFASGNLIAPEVKLVALAEKEGGDYSHLTVENVVAGKYPLDRYLLIYVRRLPGEPLDPFVKEYLRLVYSKEGQRAIAAAAPGYLPLNAREVAAELARLE
jgi:phosphate transport system substrate-binding protein